MAEADTDLSEPPPESDPRARPPSSTQTKFRDSFGPTHTGTGNLYNIALMMMRADPHRSGPLAVDQSYERELAGYFVPPNGYKEAQLTLAAGRLVLLHGPVGSGRRSAAIRLLSAYAAEDGGAIRVLAARDDDQDGQEEAGQELLPDDITDSARLLLDLSNAAERPSIRLLGVLAGLINEIRAHEAFVAVVLHRDPGPWVPDELRSSIERITRPGGAEVFVRHLTSHGPFETSPSDWTTDQRKFLAHAPMSGIRDLVSFVRQERAAHPENSPAKWLAEAFAGAASRDEQVANDAREDTYRPYRALALASAMFEGSAPNVVSYAEQQLSRILDVPQENHAWTLPDFEQRLTKIKAKVIDGRVIFDPLNYGEALCEYFWKQFPSLHQEFHAWFLKCAPRFNQTEHYDSRIIVRYASQAFKIEQPHLVAEAVNEWSSDNASFSLAARALSYGLTDQKYGRHFRQQIYTWATSGRAALSSSLARLIVSACVIVIAPRYPDQAIVRLRHLTRHFDTSVTSDAREGLARILQDDFVLRHFLARLAAYWHLDDPHNQRLFITLIEPTQLVARNQATRRLLDSPRVRDQLTICWTAAFRGLPKEEYEPSVYGWLTAQSESEPNCGLVDLLVQAASATRSLAVLHGITHRWLATPMTDSDAPRRRVVARRLLSMIDTARRDTHATGEGKRAQE